VIIEARTSTPRTLRVFRRIASPLIREGVKISVKSNRRCMLIMEAPFDRAQ